MASRSMASDGSQTYAYYTKNPISAPSGTKTITENGTNIDVFNYANVNVAVPTNSELGNFDKTIIPDKYNTGAHGYLTPFDLAGDTSGLLWQTTSDSLYLDFHTNNKQTIYNVDTSSPVFYKNIDFTAYPEVGFMNANSCSKTDQYWKAGVMIVFENCMFRKVNANYSFVSSDMIQFVFINCSMYGFKLSNAYVERCLIGNRTFYKDTFGDEDIIDGIKLFSFTNIFNCYIMDLEPKVTTSGSGHFDGLQFTDDISQSSVVCSRFECMNMPYNPKGGGWSYSIYYQGTCTNGYLINNIFHGGGNYETAVTKLQGEYSVVSGNLVEGTYSTPCYPNADYYQMTDDWATTYDTLLVSSVFFDGVNLYVICSNDIGTSKTLTVKLYTMLNDTTPARTETFSINACPTFSGSWTGIDEWDDLPFDKIYTVENVYQVNKIECYDGNTKLRTWYITEAAPIPEGVQTITSNGTYDVSQKAAVVVNVPTSVSGTKQITANGTGIDVAAYAYADVAVPQGITPTGTLPITNNGTYDVTNYANAAVNVSGGGGLPSDMEISSLVTISSNVSSFTVPYDSTRTVAGVVVIPDTLQGIAYEMTFVFCKMNFLTGTFNQTYAAFFNYNLTQEQTQINDTVGQVVSVDSSTGLITISAKSGSYRFMAGDTFRVLIIYGGID